MLLFWPDANSTLFPSGRAGIDLTIYVIAVDKSESLGQFLGTGWKRMEDQKDPRAKTPIKNHFSFIPFTFE